MANDDGVREKVAWVLLRDHRVSCVDALVFQALHDDGRLW